ncbi:Sec-dependent nitrous-oxide reductase [Opitutaceae bacterium TAV4]|nr:Sec-dependent nitrous-oxide reductase [Opitutaceae bacterium TAV4]RRK02066.1 Sec-dependent nitrous-oxide reductase [Opitutaceae bacterium TAV3]
MKTPFAHHIFHSDATTLALAAVLVSTLLLSGCNPPGSSSSGASGKSGFAGSAAARTWVGPGEMDEYYLFYSGGHSGQVFVAGLPSMRHIATIPVFAPYPGTGYGYDEETKGMLGGFTWGDVHHPGLSQTGSLYDGRWLFVNDNANNRIARIDLRDFKTHQILGPIPNSSGNHGSSFVTENTEYVLVATRFSVPLPKGRFADPADYEKEFNGMVSGIRVDPATGTMSVGWQILTPPFNWDLGSTGKGPSSGWAFWTSYNTEMAHETLEATSTQRDRDYAAVVNWRAAEAAVRDGRATLLSGVPVIDPAKVPGVIYFLPVPKSPHGIDTDPSGRWIAASGKLQPVTSVFDFEKLRAVIDRKEFETEFRGVPVIRYESVLEGEVPVGLGPLHTQYDGQGNAYTSLYIESAVAKWKLPPWSDAERADLNQVVTDKIDVHYNIGHLVVGGSDTRQPYGKYLVAMNKLSKGRHISVGPSQPESSQLIDITGAKMEMIYEAFTEPEPHFAQILKADAIKPIEVYPRAESTHPHAIWDAKDASVTRRGSSVEVKMIAIRSRFIPDRIDVNEGDELVIHVTNVEQTTDMIHGLALVEQDVNIIIDPGETKTLRLIVKKPGVFPFYCTNFCSALHQEMQGYLTVKPKS